MKDQELHTEIAGIVRRAGSLAPALHEIRSLIAREFGAALLVVRPSASGSTLPANIVSEFLESREFPVRALYTAPVKAEGREAGTLVACIGTWGTSGDILRRITTFAGEQLAALLRRLPAQSLVYTEAA